MGALFAVTSLHQSTWQENLIKMYEQVGSESYFFCGGFPLLLVSLSLIWWLCAGRRLKLERHEEHGGYGLIVFTWIWTSFTAVACVDFIQHGKPQYWYLLLVNCATFIAASMLVGLIAWQEHLARQEWDKLSKTGRFL